MSHQTDYYSNSQVVLLTSAFKNCRTLTKPDELEQFKPMIYSNTEFINNEESVIIENQKQFNKICTQNLGNKINFYVNKDIKKIKLNNIVNRCHLIIHGETKLSSTKNGLDQIFNLDQHISNEIRHGCHIIIPKYNCNKIVQIEYQTQNSDDWISYTDSRMGFKFNFNHCADLIEITLPYRRPTLEFQIRMDGNVIWQGIINNQKLILRMMDEELIYVGSQDQFLNKNGDKWNLSRVNVFEFIPLFTEQDLTNADTYVFTSNCWSYNLMKQLGYTRSIVYTI